MLVRLKPALIKDIKAREEHGETRNLIGMHGDLQDEFGPAKWKSVSGRAGVTSRSNVEEDHSKLSPQKSNRVHPNFSERKPYGRVACHTTWLLFTSVLYAVVSIYMAARGFHVKMLTTTCGGRADIPRLPPSK